MLQKKQKRKRDEVTLVPEKQQIFRGLNFFYLPPDGKSSIRRQRITLALNRGANWVKDFGVHVNYVIVDNSLTYQHTMAFFKSTYDMDVLPESIVLVNENYQIDCIKFCASPALLNPKQEMYAVKGSSEEYAVPQIPSQVAEDTMDQGPDLQRRTPPQDDPQSQPDDVEGEVGMDASSRPRSPSSEKHWALGYSDALDKMIRIAQRTKHLPLNEDEEEEEPLSPGGSMQDRGESDREGSHSPIRAPVKKKRKGTKGTKSGFNQENSSCMKGGTGIIATYNPNERTIEVLKEMADIYDGLNDQWRSRAYRKAIGSLKKQTHKISTSKEAFEIQWIGERLAQKIEEIVLTDGLRRLEYAKLDPRERVLQDFLKIYDVGPSQAGLWYQQGHRTLDDLKAHVDLTTNQQIGIDHYSDFNTRIPREQVTSLGDIVKKAAAIIDPDVEATIGGSYRRGAESSGDIDFLISKPGSTSCAGLLSFLDDLVQNLTNSGFLVAALAVPRLEKTSSSKWHGACVLPGNPIWRRIDFLLVPESEFGAALIYFTGDDIFNRSIRLLAGSKGWRLNQRGLYKDVMRGPGREKLNEGTLIEGRDEKKIFEALAVPWIPPNHRIMS